MALPVSDTIPPIFVEHPVGHSNSNGSEPFLPYKRDPETLARPWAIPGTPGLEHRLGGLSKAPLTGNVSYNPNHNEQMHRERREKIARLADVIPDQKVFGPKKEICWLSVGVAPMAPCDRPSQALKKGVNRWRMFTSVTLTHSHTTWVRF